MLVTTFLFKIKYPTPDLINYHLENRTYTYKSADYIQLTSRNSMAGQSMVTLQERAN